jgi:hypothetical protein
MANESPAVREGKVRHFLSHRRQVLREHPQIGKFTWGMNIGLFVVGQTLDPPWNYVVEVAGLALSHLFTPVLTHRVVYGTRTSARLTASATGSKTAYGSAVSQAVLRASATGTKHEFGAA